MCSQETEISNLVNSKSSSNEVIASQMQQKDNEISTLAAKLEALNEAKKSELKEVREKFQLEKNSWISKEKELLEEAQNENARLKATVKF